MATLSLQHLLDASHLGGSSALRSFVRLQPAAGEQALISPAKYTGQGGATYVLEDRFVGGEKVRTVLIDSRTSTANRIEEGLNDAIVEGHPLLSLMPHIEVSYGEPNETMRSYRDSQLPGRAFDAHVRYGTVAGTPTTQTDEYRAVRNSSPQHAAALFAMSPITVLLGGWDAVRTSKQARFPAAISGETIGVIGQGTEVVEATKRSGARIDPLGASVQLDAKDAIDIALSEAAELSSKKIAQIQKQKGVVSASNMVLGAIPPGTTAVDGIATKDIIRSYSLSFATLRRLRFDTDAEGNAAVRALLAALGIVGMVRSDAELYFRANCHLVEKERAQLQLDLRHGDFEDLAPLSIGDADTLLQEAYENAVLKAGINWNGEVFAVTGNPVILQGATSSDPDPDQEH